MRKLITTLIVLLGTVHYAAAQAQYLYSFTATATGPYSSASPTLPVFIDALNVRISGIGTSQSWTAQIQTSPDNSTWSNCGSAVVATAASSNSGGACAPLGAQYVRVQITAGTGGGSVQGALLGTCSLCQVARGAGITLTTTGSSGASTLIGTVLNIPIYSGVTSFNTRTGVVTLSSADVNAVGAITNSTSGNAATATALASTPTLCSTGQAPTGVLANGNATGCAAAGSSLPTATAAGQPVRSTASGSATADYTADPNYNMDGVNITELSNASCSEMNTPMDVCIVAPPYYGSPYGATTTTGTFSASATSGTVASCSTFLPNNGVLITGGASGGWTGTDYIGTVVSCVGTALTITPAITNAVTSHNVQHDETAAILLAMTNNTPFGVKIHFPNIGLNLQGTYLVNGPLLQTSGANAILPMPQIANYVNSSNPFGDQMLVEFKGPGSAFVYAGPIIKTSLNTSGANFIGGYDSASGGGFPNFTNVQFNPQNLYIYGPSGGSETMINGTWIQGICGRGVSVGTLSPSASNGNGVLMPTVSDNPQECWEDSGIQGFNTLMRASEHMDLSNDTFSYGTKCLVLDPASTGGTFASNTNVITGHDLWFGPAPSAFVNTCANGIVAGSTNGATIDLQGVTYEGSGTVINDPSNLLHGKVTYRLPFGTATITGGTNLNIQNLDTATALPNGTTATTQSPGDNTTDVATDAFVLANAGGTTTNALTMNNGGSGAASGSTFNGSAARTISYNTLGAAPLASPTFTGTPAAPTATGGTNTTQLATTAFVQAAIAAAGTGAGIVTYSGPSLTLSGTQYLPIGGGGLASSTETNVDIDAPAAVTIQNMTVQMSAAPGVGNSVVFTWRKNASSQTLTCTISGASATSCSDTTHQFTTASLDLLDIQAVTTGTIVGTPTLVMAAQVGVSATATTTFSNISGGTNTTAAMVVGSGASLTPGGSGTVTANGLTGSPAITVSSCTGCGGSTGAMTNIGSTVTLSGCTYSGGLISITSSGSSTCTISSIPSGNKLVLDFAGTSVSSSSNIIGVRFNSDSGSHYAWNCTQYQNTGGWSGCGNTASDTSIGNAFLLGTLYSGATIEITNYAGTTFPKVLNTKGSYGTSLSNLAADGSFITHGVWDPASQAAITSISLICGNCTASDTVAIYSIQ